MRHVDLQDPVGVHGARFCATYVEVEPGVELRILEWCPANDSLKPPVVFVPGWVSVVAGWAEVLEVLARDRRVVYIESREKRSAVTGSRLTSGSFAIPRLARDLEVACDRIGVDVPDSVFFGSSMGSNAILEALKGDRLCPRAAFLIGPNGEFHIPWWGVILIHLPAMSYHVLKHFVMWYLRKFRVNSNEDPDQMLRYERTLNAANPLRLKLSAQAVRGYSAWPRLETVSVPVGIAFADSDTLHGEGEAVRIADRLPRGEAIRCSTNTAMHRGEVVGVLDLFLVRIGVDGEDGAAPQEEA